jgi:hypothetical protein
LTLTAFRRQPAGELEGLRILCGVRVSTAHQTENWSVSAQEGLAGKLEAMGATVVPFDEQAISGTDLNKRKLLLEMLDRLDKGLADGLAYYDVKRLTRNPWGIDAGVIARRLVAQRAVFVTNARTFRLWQESDLLAFQFECLLAGIEVRSIRDTFWRGIFKRAETEMMHMGKAAIGYRVRHEVERKSNGREYDHKSIEKDPLQAEMMATMIQLLDECHSLGEVCRRLNRAGYLLTARGQHRGQRIVPWKPHTLRRMFENPLYSGTFTFGRFSRRRSPIWEEHRFTHFDHAVPELAYWTRSQVLRWRDKFKPTGSFVPQSRARKYVRGLIGVLACAECGRPMVSAGRLGYQCRAANNEPGLCPRPQVLGEAPALRELRRLLPKLLPSQADVEEGKRRHGIDRGRIVELEARVAVLETEQARDTEAWMAMSTKPVMLTRALEERERELVAAQAALERAREEASAGEEEMLRILEQIPAQEAFDKLATDQARMAVYRRLVSDVRIRGEGIARQRRWNVVSYRPKYGLDSGRLVLC